jgi:hypothetical protein
MKNKDLPLRVEITEDGILNISIGIDTLVFCAKEENGGVMKEIDDLSGIKYKLTIDNPKDFCYCIVNSIIREDELGNSHLTKFLDECIKDSLDRGNYGVEYRKL